MKKGFKKLLSLGSLTAILMVGAQISYARNIGDYDTKVPIISDYESSDLKKTNNSSAINNCTYIEKGKLVSWIENSSGNNITSKISYTTPAKRAMGYSNTKDYIGKDVHLNISTSFSTWNTVDTIGTWSPDNR